jgi:lipoate-protein ligase A
MDVVVKVEGGKMLRARGEVSDGRIASVTITGDFFLHPEEAIESLETALAGARHDREVLLAVVANELAGATLVGAADDDIVDLLMMLSE